MMIATPVEGTAEVAGAPAPSATEAGPRGGPRTPEGKMHSRANAVKHGLRSRTLLPDDLARLVADRTIQLRIELLPASPYERWLVEQVALHMTRIDRCAELERTDFQRRIERAEHCWDEDRRAEVEHIGERLSKSPSRAVAALRRSRQGALWLAERWRSLGVAVERERTWNDAQRALAHDLLGVPPELRDAVRELPPDAGPEALAELVQAQVEELECLCARSLDRLEESTRDCVFAGLPIVDDPATNRLRRYESSSRSALLWALREFRRVHGKRSIDPDPRAYKRGWDPARFEPVEIDDEDDDDLDFDLDAELDDEPVEVEVEAEAAPVVIPPAPPRPVETVARVAAPAVEVQAEPEPAQARRGNRRFRRKQASLARREARRAGRPPDSTAGG